MTSDLVRVILQFQSRLAHIAFVEGQVGLQTPNLRRPCWTTQIEAYRPVPAGALRKDWLIE